MVWHSLSQPISHIGKDFATFDGRNVPWLARARQPETDERNEPSTLVWVKREERPARVGQVLFDEFVQPQTFVQLTNQIQAAVGGDPRSLRICLQRSLEGKLKGLVLFLTDWVSTSGVFSSRSNTHEY